MIRTFSELQRLTTFKERYDYLRLNGSVGATTFGFDRYLNQTLYTSREWRSAREAVIIRDNGCDLGIDGYEIRIGILIHHMNVVTPEDIENRNFDIFNPNFLICTTHTTHQAIHYGDEKLLAKKPIVRYAGDTCPWH